MTKPSETKEEIKDTKPETKAAAKAPEPPPAPERSYRDPRCTEQARHISMCDCAGAARAPIA